ncbi:MotA/TolQ/ExbB proton channel family protein [candidate division WOR-3 bacterium]|nr:MotA/TolQ/ExbB proton channel family protein [candidate division WOR-3 bacterium]
MIDFFNRGGWTMWFLLTAAIIGILFIIERIITFIWARVNTQKLVNDITKAYNANGVEGAIRICKRNNSPIARILIEGVQAYAIVGKDKDAMEEAMEGAAVKELAFLDRGMSALSAVVTLAPMMGFLGTVSGMVSAFDAIALAGTVDAKLVASGISEALITTMTGLSIAIPISAAHTWFSEMINSYTRNMEQAANEVVTHLLEQGK